MLRLSVYAKALPSVPSITRPTRQHLPRKQCLPTPCPFHTENDLCGHTSCFEEKSLSGMQQAKVKEQMASSPWRTSPDWAPTRPSRSGWGNPGERIVTKLPREISRQSRTFSPWMVPASIPKAGIFYCGMKDSIPPLGRVHL